MVREVWFIASFRLVFLNAFDYEKVVFFCLPFVCWIIATVSSCFELQKTRNEKQKLYFQKTFCNLMQKAKVYIRESIAKKIENFFFVFIRPHVFKQTNLYQKHSPLIPKFSFFFFSISQITLKWRKEEKTFCFFLFFHFRVQIEIGYFEWKNFVIKRKEFSTSLSPPFGESESDALHHKSPIIHT